ncbi:ornithine decarboxylase 1-like [Choristoneura fumiferana]|uniref:ornithine decarboxylase 1-like n=1 Tax=Choristoneura fumiferana TaxID=7141 RepID=UPI003D158BD5
MKVLEEEPRVEVTQGAWSAAQAARDIVASGGGCVAQEEPFYVCDLRELAARHARWRDLMPRVEPFYAVKCNDDKLLLRTLAALGTGFDCASRGEIDLVTNLGVAPERIIFANPAKMASHIRHAASAGVDTMTFDSEPELLKIKQHMPHAQLVLRIRCDAASAQCPLGIKFGCDPVAEAPRLLKLAAVLGLDVIGVSFHVGSGAEETEVYARAIQYCRALFTLGAALGHARMRLVDIGGGFPGGSGTSIKEVAEVINTALETHFPEPGVRVIAEPGRYFAAAAYTLAVMVHAKREVVSVSAAGGEETHTMYFINDGVYGSFNCVLYDHQQVEPTLLYPSSEKPQPCSIWGPTCDGLDCVLPAASLPPLQVGTWLLFKDMGAYTLPAGSNFNGFPLPRVKTFVDEALWSVLKEQSPFSECQFSVGRAAPPSLPCAAGAVRDPAECRAVFVECALK